MESDEAGQYTKLDAEMVGNVVPEETYVGVVEGFDERF